MAKKVKSRVERDTMGEVEIPAGALWGANTERARLNLPISHRRMPWALLKALANIKDAMAEAAAEKGSLDQKKADAIRRAAEEGGLLGWAAGHGLIALANPWVEDQTGVTIGLFDTAPPVNLLAYLSEDPIMEWEVSTKWILIPSLILLAIVVGFLPALAAYRTDVAESLSANP